MSTQQIASARKSGSEFKAVVIHRTTLGSGFISERTEILGKISRPMIWRGKDPLPGGPERFVRGKTFPTRAQAVEYAKKTIDLWAQKRAEAAAKRAARHEAKP